MATATQERPKATKAKTTTSQSAPTAVAGSPSKAKASKAAKPTMANSIATKARKAIIDAFKLASDETRFRVLEVLSQGERNVTDLCEMMATSQPALSHHLALLRAAKLIEGRREGKFNFYALAPAGTALWTACSTYAAAITANG